MEDQTGREAELMHHQMIPHHAAVAAFLTYSTLGDSLYEVNSPIAEECGLD